MSTERFEAYIGTGIAHVHTNEDGGIGKRGYSLAQLLAYYRDHSKSLGGDTYLAICEHASNPGRPHRLEADDRIVKHLLAELAEVRRSDGDPKLFFGVEASILQTGDLDIPHELATEVDFVISSHHALPRRIEHNAKAISGLMEAAIDNPATTILGHPNRFIYNVPVDWGEIMEAAKAKNVAIEININIFPRSFVRHRLLSNSVISHWNYFLECIARTDVPVFIGSDIHLNRQLEAWCHEAAQSMSPAADNSRLAYVAGRLAEAGIKPAQIVNANATAFEAWLSTRS